MMLTAMPVRSIALAFALALVQGGAIPASGSEVAPGPAGDGTVLVAVNGEPVTLGELRRLVRELRFEAEMTGEEMPEPAPEDLVDRLVNLHLVFQESRNIGFDTLPEFETAVEAFRTDTLRGLLLNAVAAEAPEPPAETVEARYREIATEYQVSSALFSDQESARAFRDGLESADGYAGAAERARENGVADRVQIGVWIPRRDLAPEIIAGIEGLEDGAVGEPFPFGTGVAVVRRIASRLPEDAGLRETARRDARSAARTAALEAFVERLREERMEIDDELLAALDFDARSADFDAFVADERVLARLDDAEDVRVGEVAAAVRKRMFHGVEQAAEKGRLNRARDNVLEELTTERALQAEARRRGLDREPAFVEDLEAYENRVLFGMFVRRVVVREVKITSEAVRAEYEAHLADYTDPGMARLDSIVFSDAEGARRALERVNAGADFAWLRTNAGGQAAPGDVPQDSRLGGRLLMIAVLPAGLRAAIEGAGAGDYRLWAEAEGLHHVVAVIDRVDPKPRPLETVENDIASRLHGEALQAALEGWFSKLREVSEIEYAVEGDALRDLVSGPGKAGD